MACSSVQPLQQPHQAKFRWTENLTCRFIQLRKEHGKMFTGRKYSAQAGWEYILRQMREEFPTIMADVHYRVLKKKWSNLLQQYKELKNPVHGDKNKADDISWPFYNAIDEVLCNLGLPRGRRLAANSPDCYDELDDEEQDEDLNPQEFLCVSVAPDSDDEEHGLHVTNSYEDEPMDERAPQLRDEEAMGRAVPGLQPLGRGPVFDVDRLSRAARHSPTSGSSRKRSLHAESSSEELLSRLPRATELTIRPIRRGEGSAEQQLPPPGLEPINGRGELEIFRDTKRPRRDAEEEDERPRRAARQEVREEEPAAASRLERRFLEYLDYTRKRDEENRAILMRMLEAIEDIRSAVKR